MNTSKASEFFEYLEAFPLTDEYFINLKASFFNSAVRYAHIRAQWAISDLETRRNDDGTRTAAHNAFIDWTNALSRFLADQGEDVSWRKELSNDRKVIGDFACYLHAVLGISAR